MSHAPMGRFQLESKLELPLFSGFTIVQHVEKKIPPAVRATVHLLSGHA